MSRVKCPGCNQMVDVDLGTMTAKCSKCDTDARLQWTWHRPNGDKVRKPDYMIDVKIIGDTAVGKTSLKKIFKNALIQHCGSHDFLVQDLDASVKDPIMANQLTAEAGPIVDGKLRHITFSEETR